MSVSNRDTIYATPQQQVADFRFDENVADVFTDMARRSIPGYETILKTLGELTQSYAQENTNLYDLGCSLGAASLAMRRNIQVPGCKIVAVDNSKAMLSRCQRHLDAYRSDTPVEYRCDDIMNIEFDDASIVTMNFTLQFLPPEQRPILLKRIYEALRPGGMLFLSEKFTAADPVANELLNNMYLDFKRQQGYSELEISQKRTALENVMRIDPLDSHIQRLQQAGFAAPQVWFQCFNFCSMVAVKV